MKKTTEMFLEKSRWGKYQEAREIRGGIQNIDPSPGASVVVKIQSLHKS